MQIEVTTTKKKLTKNLLKQMRGADEEVLKSGNVLGFILNALPRDSKIMLIEYQGDYHVMSMRYEKGEQTIYRRGRSGSMYQIRFKTSEDAKRFYQLYQRACEKAEKNHIYI